MGLPLHYGDASRGTARAAVARRLVRRESWFAAAQSDCHFMHCLPVRRNVAVADEVLGRAALARHCRGREPHGRADGRAASIAQKVRKTMIGHKGEQAVTVRALRGAAPYIHMYKGKVFVIKTGGGAFREPEAMRAFVEQVANPAPPGHPRRARARRRAAARRVTAKLGVETRMVQGRRVTTGAAIEATSMVLNGLINTQLLALCRSFGIAAIGLSGVDGGLVQAHRRPPGHARERRGRRLRHGRRHRLHRRERRHALLDAGFLPVVSPLVVRHVRTASQHQRRHRGRRDRRRARRRES
jgi:hypothetical protein